MTTLLLNTFTATSIRLVTPWKGVWHAEVDFDLEALPIVPSGPAIVKIGLTNFLRGTIDERASGRIGAKAGARVVGGGGGWDKPVLPIPLPNDAGVLSTAILTATAAEVGEQLVDMAPELLGKLYVRSAGPASRVLEGRQWYVNQLGITVVGPRIPLPALPSVEILDWNPKEQRAELACDDIVSPGTILIDTRFGTAIVRDVEQTWGPKGARATAWCSSKSRSRLAEGLQSLVHETALTVFHRKHVYIVLAQLPDDRLMLQATKVVGELPPILPAVSMMPGMAGHGAKLTPGTEVVVTFLDADPSKPRVTQFDDTIPPLELSLDFVARCAIGLGTFPLVVGSPALLQWVVDVTKALNALAPGSAILPVPMVSPRTFSD